MQRLTITAAHKNFRSIDFVRLLREYFGWTLLQANKVAVEALAGNNVEVTLEDDAAEIFLEKFQKLGGKLIDRRVV